MGRRIELNEKFDCFINRLVKKAETITTTNYKIDVVVEQFSKCLRPIDLEVIQLFPDQCTGTGLNLLRAKAKLLDDRKYNSKVEVNAHQVDKLTNWTDGFVSGQCETFTPESSVLQRFYFKTRR